MQFNFKFNIVLLLVLAISSSFAQEKNIPVLKIGDSVVTLEEFEREYIRSTGNKNTDNDKFENYKEFLDLYSGFKLKLIEAKEKGYDVDENLLKEFEVYKKTVSQSYYTTKYIKEAGMKELYKKSLVEYRAAHILLKADSLRDVEQSHKLAISIIDSLNNGSDWSNFVKKYSDDKTTLEKDGDIYYYSGVQLPQDIQYALFNTEVNQVYQKPIKSRFGWHIMRVTEKRDRIAAVRAKHILIMHKDSTGNYDEARAEKLCKELHQRVLNGENFSELAKKYSDDKGSGQNGGDLNFVPRRQTVKEFDEVLFNTKPGEISEVFRTQFGYHFLTVIEQKKPESYSDFIVAGSKLYDKKYYNVDYRRHLDKLIKEHNYEINNENIEKLNKKYFNLTLAELAKDEEAIKEINKLDFMKSGKVDFTLESVIREFAGTKFSVNKLSAELLSNLIRNKIEKKILSDITNKLDTNDEDFKKIMSDYKNGLMIFKLQENHIWNTIKVTSQERKDFYLKNKKLFKWPERLIIFKFNHSDSKTLEKVINVSKEVQHLNPDMFADIKDLEITKDTLLITNVNQFGRVAKKLKEGEVSSIFRTKNGKLSAVKLEKKLEIMPKSFKECTSEIASKIMEQKNKIAEKKYIDGLKESYEPEYFYENLKKAFK